MSEGIIYVVHLLGALLVLILSVRAPSIILGWTLGLAITALLLLEAF